MSLITRCPACATTFKVVADQLRISDGWVRCGQCAEVFDATAHLLTDPPTPAPSALPWRPSPVSPPPRAEPPAFLKSPAANTRSAPAPSPSAHAEVEPRLGQYAAEQRRAQEASMPALPERLPNLPSALATPPDALEATEARPKPPSADELLAAQLARLDLNLSQPSPELPPTDEVDEALRALDGIFDIVPERDLEVPVFQPDPLSLQATPRTQPEGDRFPVLSVPELDLELPGAAAAPRPAPAGVTLGALQFPGDPAQGRDPSVAKPAQTEAISPAGDALDAGTWERPLPPDEVSPSLLSESQAGETPGDLSTQWAAESVLATAAPLATPAPQAPLSAQDEVDAYGRPDLQQLQFLKRARSQAFWRQTWVRLSLVLLILLSTAALALQMVWHERDRLAANEPLLKPGLLAMCQLLSCELAPWRRIEPLLIESSSFNKSRGGTYQFALTVHNTSGVPLAMPATELTLTDAQDQPVLRRVFPAVELGAPASLAAGAEWSGSWPVSVAGASGLRIAGYRVLVFYP